MGCAANHPAKIGGMFFILDFLFYNPIIGGKYHRPNSLVVKHVLGKDESQVRFLLRAPGFINPWTVSR